MDLNADVLVISTGLSESIAAAALSKAGLKVVHIDNNIYYGAEEASLTLDELSEWSLREGTSEGSRFISLSTIGMLPPRPKTYSASLSPSLVPARGPLIDALIGSGVSRYCNFKLCEKIFICTEESVKRVPTSKEEIFKSRHLSLIDKRRVMRFLTFASGDFENSPELQGQEAKTLLAFLKDVFSMSHELAAELTLSLALCQSYDESVLVSLQRVRSHLISFGRYGPSPFLFGQYGGLGELAQGFCRVCAVSGGVYILGHRCSALVTGEEDDTAKFKLKLEDFPHDITARVILAPTNFVHKFVEPRGELHEREVQACCIVIVDGLIVVEPQEDRGHDSQSDSNTQTRPTDSSSALIIFPPELFTSDVRHGAVQVIINGDDTLSCPPGKALVYLSTKIFHAINSNATKSDPEKILRPYIDSLLSKISKDSSSLKEIYSAFFLKKTRGFSDEFAASLKQKGVIVCPDLPEYVVESGNTAAVVGQKNFEDALAYLGKLSADTQLWPPLPLDWNDDND